MRFGMNMFLWVDTLTDEILPLLEDIKQMGFDEQFRRKWIYYLSYCEAGFDEGSIDVGIYQYRKPL